MIAEFILILLTLAVVYFGATWIERDKHREREDALLDALDDAVDTITELNKRLADAVRHPSRRHLESIGGAS